VAIKQKSFGLVKIRKVGRSSYYRMAKGGGSMPRKIGRDVLRRKLPGIKYYEEKIIVPERLISDMLEHLRKAEKPTIVISKTFKVYGCKVDGDIYYGFFSKDTDVNKVISDLKRRFRKIKIEEWV